MMKQEALQDILSRTPSEWNKLQSCANAKEDWNKWAGYGKKEYVRFPGQIDHRKRESNWRDLSNICLNGVCLNDRQLCGACFANSVIKDASLCRCSLRAADFSGCSISQSDFSGALLFGVNFARAKFHQVNFSGAFIYWCNFDKAIFEKTNFLPRDICVRSLDTISDLSPTIAWSRMEKKVRVYRRRISVALGLGDL